MKFLSLWMLWASLSYGQSFDSFIQQILQSPAEARGGIVEQYLSAQKSSPITEDDTLVHFVLYGAANTVLVNGDLQRWLEPDTLSAIRCGRYSLFYRTYTLPSDARLDYIFIVDGREILDPANPLTTPSGFGRHSDLRMPKFVPSPFLVRRSDIPQGRIEDITVHPYIVPPLKQYWRGARPIKVYLPPGYDTLMNVPAVYVQDGFETIKFAFLPTVIDNLIAESIIEPVMAVFIAPADRGEEQMGFFHEPYKRYICEELVPMIDSKYKTNRTPEKRALIGVSSGGHSALSIVLSRTDLFRNAGGQSSTITSSLEKLVQKNASVLPTSLKIYLDCGRYDLLPHWGEDFFVSNRNFSQLLSSLRIPHYFKEVNDGHQWASWRERMPEMLIYFFRKKY